MKISHVRHKRGYIGEFWNSFTGEKYEKCEKFLLTARLRGCTMVKDR
jgi:hypothetical protein